MPWKVSVSDRMVLDRLLVPGDRTAGDRLQLPWLCPKFSRVGEWLLTVCKH